MVAVVAGERVEEDGDRLQDEHVEIGGDDEHAPVRRARAGRSGNARSACTSTAKTRFDASTPTVYAAAPFASCSTLISDVKPTAQSSRPKRAYGGSRSASTPVPTNVRQTIAVSSDWTDGMRRDPADGDHVDGGAGRGQRRASSRTGAAAARGAVTRAAGSRGARGGRARLRSRSLQQPLERRAGEVAPSRRSRVLRSRSISGPYADAVAARDEHDLQLRVAREQSLGDLEAVEVGELDVEQDEVGRQLGREARAPTRRPPPRRRRRTPPRGAARSRSGGSSDGRRRRARAAPAAACSSSSRCSTLIGTPFPRRHYLYSQRRARVGGRSRPWRAGARAPARRSACGSHSSQRGRYQFHSPSSFITAGSSTAADDGRVDQDRGREPEAHLLDVERPQRHEDREHGDHHDRGARHRRRRCA